MISWVHKIEGTIELIVCMIELVVRIIKDYTKSWMQDNKSCEQNNMLSIKYHHTIKNSLN